MGPVSHETRQDSMAPDPTRWGSPISWAEDARSEVDGARKKGFFPCDAATAAQHVCAAPPDSNGLSGAAAGYIHAYSRAWDP